MVKETEKHAGAVTKVFWDIKKCPVPSGFDARLVAPCIKRFLKKLGYFGPLSISAFGLLTDISDDVLRAVSSTGIVLQATPFGSRELLTLVSCWTYENPPPANFMLISDPTVSNSYNLSMLKYNCGYNVINPYRYGPYSSMSLWEKFLLAGALEVDDRCIETDESAPWFCYGCLDLDKPGLVCTTGQGFETFDRHLSSLEHEHEMMLRSCPSRSNPRVEKYDDDECDDDECDDYECDDEEWDDEHPDIFQTAYPQPKTWDWYSQLGRQMSATSIADTQLKTGEQPGESAAPSERPHDCAITMARGSDKYCRGSASNRWCEEVEGEGEGYTSGGKCWVNLFIIPMLF